MVEGGISSMSKWLRRDCCFYITLASITSIHCVVTAQTFRSDVKVVQVDVIASSKRSGKPVKGLTKNDLVVFDEGKKQTIESMEELSWRVGARPAEAAEAGWITNRRYRLSADGLPAAALLVDGYNSRFEDVHDAMKAVRTALQDSPWRGAIYGLFLMDERGIHVLQDWTDSAAAVVDRAKTQGPFTVAGADPEGLSHPDDDQRVRLLHTLGAIEAIGEHMQSIPRRRSIVWLTSGFPLKLAVEYSADWESSMRRLNVLGVAVYPVDAAGLRALPGFSAVAGASRTSATRGPGFGARVNANIEMMLEIAARTGGLAFKNSNNLAAGLKQAFDDDQVVYRVYFRPTHERWDGRFHQIAVKPQRHDIRVRYRAGYTATAGSDVPGPARMEALTRSPVESTGIGLSVRLRPSAQGTIAQIVADPDGLSFAFGQGQWQGRFEVWMLLLRVDGVVAKEWKVAFSVMLSEEKRLRMSTDGLAFEQAIPADVQYTGVRVFLSDLGNGRVGSLTVPAAIPGEWN